MSERTLSMLDGSTFVVGDRLGDVRSEEVREHGFYSNDTRFLSRWVLHVDEAPLELLGIDQSAHFAAQLLLTPRIGPEDVAPCSIVRRRLIDHVWTERLTIINHRHESSKVRLALEVDTDFADLFEVKDGMVAEREVTSHQHDGALTLSYARAGFQRSITIATSRPATVSRNGFHYSLLLAPGEQWSTTFTLTPHAAQPGVAFAGRVARGALAQLSASKAAELEEWLSGAPVLQASDASLMRTYRASLSDLGALRLHPDLCDGETLPAAGLPWFMALFGRDSLITRFQALPYLPGLAATALRVLAGAQAQSRDDWGVRTLGSSESGYNPLGYHTGTVWPHENSLIAAGLTRYGHSRTASTVASAMLRAAPYFEHRLPAGYATSVASVPVAFPTASRPQAWAAGTLLLLLLTTLLDLQPGRTDANLEIPAGIGRVVLRPQKG